MFPRYAHNDFVITIRWPYARFNKGDIVVMKHPSLGLVIKRILAKNRQQVLLVGENSLSTDSEQLGWQSTEHIIGKVLWRSRSS